MAGHDEGAADVAVFDEAFAVGFAQVHGQLQGAGAAGIGNGHHHVDFVCRQAAFHFFGQGYTHIEPRLVHRYAVHHGIRAGEIHVFKQAGQKTRRFGALAAVKLAIKADKHGFARRNIAHQFIAQAGENDGFGRHHIGGAPRFVGRFAQHQRADTVRIAEGEHTVAGNQRHHAVCTAHLAVERGHGIKHIAHFQLAAAADHVLQLAGQHVEQHFRIGAGVDVAQVAAA